MAARAPADSAKASGPEAQRIDKWLWVARFFKTRSLATAAVAGGKVQVDGERVKPARQVRPGSALRIRRDLMQWEVVVRALSPRRLPAKEAIRLYEESAESIVARTGEIERRRQVAAGRTRGLGRPTKRDRRDLDRLKPD